MTDQSLEELIGGDRSPQRRPPAPVCSAVRRSYEADRQPGGNLQQQGGDGPVTVGQREDGTRTVRAVKSNASATPPGACAAPDDTKRAATRQAVLWANKLRSEKEGFNIRCQTNRKQ